jgi:streptogramin lyase
MRSDILLLNGETGAIEQTIAGVGSFFYGGAADADGNFWGLDTGGGQLVRVDIDDFSVQTWPLGPTSGYGITVGPMGRPWTCGGGGVARFNLDTETWDTAGSSGIGGCMTDGESIIWHSNSSGLLLGYDIETLQVVSQVQLPEYVHGVSVDFDGYVWGVGFANSNAYRADPMTGDVQTFNQLVGAYTYSDMTGFALSSAGSEPPEG